MNEKQRTLQETSNEGLLQALKALTHRLHTIRSSTNEVRVREQRNAVEDEILRRMVPNHIVEHIGDDNRDLM